MHLPKTATLLSLAAAALVAVAPAASAQDAAATPVKVTGAYLFVNTLYSTHERHATLVFRTDRRIPRRADGRIEADATIAHQHAPRLQLRTYRAGGSMTGRAATPPPSHRTSCYQTGALIRKDNTIEGQANGRTVRTSARVGAKLAVEIIVRTDSGFTRIKRTLTLRAARPGDTTGRSLGC